MISLYILAFIINLHKDGQLKDIKYHKYDAKIAFYNALIGITLVILSTF